MYEKHKILVDHYGVSYAVHNVLVLAVENHTLSNSCDAPPIISLKRLCSNNTSMRDLDLQECLRLLFSVEMNLGKTTMAGHQNYRILKSYFSDLAINFGAK
jgi:hypothetical protein